MENDQIIYLGKRDNSFTNLIRNILKTGNLSKEYRDKLLDPKGLSYYSTAFTHPSADSENNYEFLETLGDVTVNKCVLWYLSKRFPQINCPDGKGIITKLKIKIIQGKSFGPLAEQMGFWDYISSEVKIRGSLKQKTKILEDVFESFFGTTELLLDSHFGVGVGYAVCYKIVSKLLDNINISLNYESLVDPKTRLKELFDYYKLRGIGTLSYIKMDASEVGEDKVFNIAAQQTFPDKKTRFIGRGKGYEVIDAEQEASKIALEFLKSENITRPIPKEYIKFCS